MAKGIISPFIHPEKINGTYHAPPSKSVAQRAAALSLIREGKTIINNYGDNEDGKVALAIIDALGATVERKPDGQVVILSKGLFNNEIKTNVIQFGESGLSARMFLPLLALLGNEFTVNADGSLRSRPFRVLLDILKELEVSIKENGSFPFSIKGPIHPKEISIDGSQSSQFLTGMLFAYAAGKHEQEIEVQNLVSHPYVDLTIDLIEDFDIAKVKNREHESFKLKPKNAIPNKTKTFSIEGDWSSAAFMMVAAAIAGQINITGLDVFSKQSDKSVIEALMDCSCRMSITEKNIDISTVSNLRPFQFDATHAPDLFPPLTALAAYCEGTSVIVGTHRLKNKESNRAFTLISEFSKMGLDIKEQDDLLIIKGGDLKGAELDAHNDHRIAMALSIAALRADGATTINGIESVNKSYPGFFKDLSTLGAKIKIDE